MHRIIVTGASGMIGSRLVKRLLDDGHSVHAFVRDLDRAAERLPQEAQLVHWTHADDSGDWLDSIDGAHAVVNLAGATVGQRWTESQKKRIRESRILGTRHLVDAMGRAKRKPSALINASAVGFYGVNPIGEIDENSPPGNDFLASVCVDWEAEANRAMETGIRVVVVRSGVVLDAHEGPLQRMLLPFRLFAGGPIGTGRQPLPWIHIDDEVGILRWALQQTSVVGPINAVAPGAVTNREFTRALGRSLHRPSFLPTPAFVVGLVLGEGRVIVTGGQQVVPRRALELGFRFEHTEVEESLDSLVGKR